jgi:hypothetical protein
MKKLFLLLLVLGTIPVLAQRSVPAIPWGFVDTVKYPIFHKFEAMPAIKMAELGLRPVRLDTAIVMFNWYESRKRFMLDTLQKGVVVAVDSTGRPLYKADCSNRLVLAKYSLPSDSSKTIGSGPEKDSFLKSLAKSLWSFIGDLFNHLFWLLLTLLGLALLALLGWLIFEGGRRIFRSMNPVSAIPVAIPPAAPIAAAPAAASASAAPAAPAPAPAVPTVAATATAPVPTPGERRFIAFYPGEEEQMLRYSGFRDVRLEEEGGVTTLRFRNI